MGLPKGKTAALKARAAKAKQELESNLPYVAKQFGEHVESTVEKAKAEINAYMVTTLQRAGLEGIANGTATLERKGVVKGKRGSVRENLGGRRILKKKKETKR